VREHLVEQHQDHLRQEGHGMLKPGNTLHLRWNSQVHTAHFPINPIDRHDWMDELGGDTAPAMELTGTQHFPINPINRHNLKNYHRYTQRVS
jgi:hypothetical protein